ncbi:MAG: dTDP-4-dehydrorhamnose reductase [Candidatus Thiodiazotropha sp. (ex Monitilora ramsayi)]|nr:dTDP-4-dehydrorhamnose reductase [Candidatus Thiodiazotropha sp. (ex Monitilora ramsayi)]
MKILLFGPNGQVGRELQRSLSLVGEVRSCDRSVVDLEDSDRLRAVIKELQADVVVNAAAYTAVDHAENEPQKAKLVNTDAVAIMAEEVKRQNSLLFHYSTDYVFDGEKTSPYEEVDIRNPINVYGRTKRDSELAVIGSECRFIMFRISWIYSLYGSNFFKKMLSLASEKREIKVIADQIGAPTSAALVADVTAFCLYRLRFDDVSKALVGETYHVAPSGHTSWYDYARFVLTEATKFGIELRVKGDEILPVTTDDYPLTARRPRNSRLNTSKLESRLNIVLPAWEYHLKRHIQQIPLRGYA